MPEIPRQRSHSIGRHARPAPLPRRSPEQDAGQPYAPDDTPGYDEYPPMPTAGRVAERPALAYVQLLGAPVQLSPRPQDMPRHPEWRDEDTLLLDPGPLPAQRIPPGLVGRRTAAIAAPVVVLGMVGALAFTLLTGHGPKFDQLSAQQGNQPPLANQPMGAGLVAAAFATYPGQQQRGVFESVNRIVASGTTIVATAQRSSGGSTRQQFYVSANGGVTWQLAAIPADAGPGHIAPLLAGGPGGWVAVGSQAIWTSPDGRSWTLAATHGISHVPGDQVWVVTKTAAGFLAGGSDATGQGVVWTSPDGATWHRQTLGAHVQNIAYATAHGNDILITGTLAGGGSGAWLSRDGGSSWTQVTIPGSHGAGATIAGVAWDADGLLAVRAGNSGTAITAYFSQNGLSWHYAGTIAASGGLRPRVVKGNGNGLVIAGQNNSGQLVAYLSTDNGASWRPTATLGNAAAESVVGAAVAPGRDIIAVGATAASPVSQQPVFLAAPVRGGSAGSVRTIVLPGANTSQLSVNAMADAGGAQIAVGSADGYPAIWRLVPARAGAAGTWSLVTQPGQFGSQGLAALTGITHGPSGWLAVGANNLLLTSPDGVTWRAVGGTAVLAAADLLAAAAGPAGYVIVGQQLTQAGSVPAAAWISPNQTSLTMARGLGGSGEMRAVTATPRGFVAVGAANGHPAVWTSYGGRAWTLTQLSSPGAVLRQVAANGDRIVAMGATAAGAPLAELSSDGGTTWRQVTLGSPGPGTVITALTTGTSAANASAVRGGFTAIGESGAPGREQIVAWTSPDGAAWTRALVGDQGGTRTITALAAFGSTVTGVGQVATPQSQQTVLWTSR